MATDVSLKTYDFTVTLSGTPEIRGGLTDDEFMERAAEVMDQMAGKLLAAGCDDATLSAQGETYYLGFDREAASLGDAVGSAIRDVERAGFKVARVDVEAADGA
jgi:hypothetical protein